MQAVGTEGLSNFDALFLLPLEVVEAEGTVNAVGQLLNGHGLDLLPGVQDVGLCGDLLVLADLELIIKGIPGECAEGLHHHHGDAELLQQDAELPGQGGGGAVKGVTGLGVHQHAGAQGLEAVLHVLDEPHVGDVLLGGDTADGPHDPLHQAPQADEAVVGGHDVEDSGEEHLVDDLHIQETGVVHQDQAGLVLVDALQVHFIFKFRAHEAEEAQHLDQQPPEQIDAAGRFALGLGQSHDLFIVHGLDSCFHFRRSSYCFWGGHC